MGKNYEGDNYDPNYREQNLVAGFTPFWQLIVVVAVILFIYIEKKMGEKKNEE